MTLTEDRRRATVPGPGPSARPGSGTSCNAPEIGVEFLVGWVVDPGLVVPHDLPSDSTRLHGTQGLAPEVAGHLRALQDDDPAVRDPAGRALGELGDPAALDALVAAATLAPGSEDLVWALTQFRDARVVGPLVLALHAADETVRWLAASTLGDLGDVSPDRRIALGAAREPLLTVLRRDAATAVCEQAARALGFTGDQTVVQPLIDALRGDERWQVREAAAAALGQLRANRAAGALGQAQHDRHAAVRRAAEAALRRLRPTA